MRWRKFKMITYCAMCDCIDAIESNFVDKRIIPEITFLLCASCTGEVRNFIKKKRELMKNSEEKS